MPEFASLLQQGASQAWLFIPSAILLGALHGLEPGHSKTMMAAFIVAIRGTVGQATMLGLAATVSHTAVVWAVAMGGLYLGRNWTAESAEPYLQVASAVLIVGVALWMMWRTRQQQGWDSHAHGEHEHSHRDHGHSHADAVNRIDSGHGVWRLEVFEQGVPPRFRLSAEDGHGSDFAAAAVAMETERPDGRRQGFSFVQREGFLESVEEIPEPHEFIARVRLGHGDHTHDFDFEYTEAGHEHAVGDLAALDLTAPGYQDPHELAHANDIRRRFSKREVTNGQILLFGLTGGLIPCPAAITVLLLCLQLKEITLGAMLVICFSIGLALTLVLSGVVAAVSVRHASKRWSGFGEFARKAPYFSGGLILMVGLYIGYQGLVHLP
jgi:nickel/cobalt transporter (NicO) family protein